MHAISVAAATQYLQWSLQGLLSARMTAGSSLLDLPLQQEVLPYLSAAELCSLACASKQLHIMVMSADLHIWRKAAAAVLGPNHPAVCAQAFGSTESTESLQAALQQHALVSQNLKTGAHSTGGPRQF